jgi:hypothetical protein
MKSVDMEDCLVIIEDQNREISQLKAQLEQKEIEIGNLKMALDLH